MIESRLAAAFCLVTLAALAACGTQDAPPAAAVPEPATTAATANADRAPPSITTGQGSEDAQMPAPGASGMDKTCGGATFRIVHARPAGDDAGGKATLLQLVGQDGTASPVAKPEEMHEYTAVGLGCALAEADGKPYFVVQYGELPFGCEFCEWFYLYDATGKQLTSSNPPLLTDTSLPDGEQQSANTREYEEMIAKLGIKHPEVEYIQ